MIIEWHLFAKRDFDEILEYTITVRNHQDALNIQQRFDRQISTLKTYPYAGRPGRIRNTRELVILRTPFIASYRITNDRIIILRILHGARRWPIED